MRSAQDSFLSANKKDTIFVRFFEPSDENTKIAAVIQLSHGMCEYVERYAPHAEYFTSCGFVFCGHDHLGHGNTAVTNDYLGYTVSADFLIDDLFKMTKKAKEKYPSLRVFMFGHSMGSFIVRLAAVKYIKPDKLIVMGTGGPNPVAGLGISVAKLIKRIYGEKHVSPLLYSMAFGSYNAKFKAENDSKSWLTKDIGIRNKYKAEKLCMFKFTVSAMQDLITLNKNSNTKIWFESAAKICPILLVSGELDPVGENGKGVETVYNNLKSNGADVKLKLYKNCRH